jgi:hypothetical protein
VQADEGDRAADGGLPRPEEAAPLADACLVAGFGRIVISEIEAPNTLANLV